MGEYKSDWFPGKVTRAYREGYDRISWEKDAKFADSGKARQSTSSKLIQVDDAIRLARTPPWKRKEGDYKDVQ